MMKYDLAEYIIGDGRGVVASSGEVFRSIPIKTGHLNMRNRNWRHVYADEHFVYAGMDLADENMCYVPTRNAYHGSNASLYGRPWVRRYMEIGETFSQSAFVIHLNRSNGKPLPNPSNATIDWKGVGSVTIHLLSHLDHYEGFDDVLILEWWGSGIVGNGYPIETYWYAKNLGLVGWADHKWAASLDGGVRNVATGLTDATYHPAALSWFEPNDHPFAPAHPPPTPPPDHEIDWRWSSVTAVSSLGFTNIRAGRSEAQALRGRVRLGDVIEVGYTGGKPIEIAENGQGWNMVRVDGVVGWIGGWFQIEDTDPPDGTPVKPDGEVGAQERRLKELEQLCRDQQNEIAALRSQIETFTTQFPLLRAYALQLARGQLRFYEILSAAIGDHPISKESVQSMIEKIEDAVA
jgi:hypothetical protein